MGNQQSRTPDMADVPGSSSRTGNQNNDHQERQERTRNRLSRADFFSLYGSGNGSRPLDAAGSSGAPELGEDEPFRRKETRQERDARKREKERATREKERERSLREEGVDGGYLVTLGTYVGPEDFSKAVVRQLQIERRLAPFWKGLDSHDPTWTDYQVACAFRGLPVPDTHTNPPPGFFPPPATESFPSALLNIHEQNFSIPPFGSSDHPCTNQTSTSPLSNKAAAPAQRASFPFKSRGTRLAAALSFGSPRSPSEAESSTSLREVMLPPDLYINGQIIEAALYRHALECPICFLSYPPYLNYTRCCLQPICSECFVQIKRPDPHLPEHHVGVGGDGTGSEGNHGLNSEDELVSEPSTCPYCQQSELGVTYNPPPFQRGLVYVLPTREGLASQASVQASSSPTSLTSTPNPPTTSATRRRARSLSATAPNVVTTDHIRPDWAVKLYTAQQVRAKRAAAATALHTAAFMPSHQSGAWGGRLALFRRMTEAGPSSGPIPHRSGQSSGTEEPGPSGRSRLEELEQVMVQDAIRQSLVHQGEHARKEAKKQEKEERKAKEKEEKLALKQQKTQACIYGSGTSSGASRSSLSLPFGRMRGNSASSILRFGAAPQNTIQNHEEPEQPSSSAQPLTQSKGKAPERPYSLLRHMSNVSSMQSALERPVNGFLGATTRDPDSPSVFQENRASGASLISTHDSDDGNTSGNDPDLLFNYRSMAEGMGIDIDTGRIKDFPTAILHPPRAQYQYYEDEYDDSKAVQSVSTLKTPSPDPSNNFTLKHNGTFAPAHASVCGTGRENILVPPPELHVTPGTPVSGPGESSDKTPGIGPSRIVETREMVQ